MSCCCWRQDSDIKEIYEPALKESQQAYSNTFSSPIFDENRDTYRSPSPIGSENESVANSSDRQHGGSVRCASAIRDDTSAFGTISIYSCSEYERAMVGDGDAMSTSTLLPTWMNDKETDTCWGCTSLFQTKTLFSSFIPVSGRSSPMDKTRKHHCRRCRNVFCSACVTNKQIILLARGSDINGPGTSSSSRNPNKLVPTRVCDACTLELPAENLFLQHQRPLLLQGEVFKKAGGFMSSFSTKLSRLSLTADEFSLFVQTGKDHSSFSDGTDQRMTLAFGEIEDIRITKLTRLEILQTDGKVMSLEADTAATACGWEVALKAAASRAKQGSLKNRIELERRQRVESNRRGEEEEKKREYMTQKREVARQEREALRSKYKR